MAQSKYPDGQKDHNGHYNTPSKKKSMNKRQTSRAPSSSFSVYEDEESYFPNLLVVFLFSLSPHTSIFENVHKNKRERAWKTISTMSTCPKSRRFLRPHSGGEKENPSHGLDFGRIKKL
ncbi:hypothetical protein OUZ56_027898 [Daphnia magna]|uniref:Uncharacterized protein n=1 Tax=Daphnia magna TaxID=35525 RepID=A0ABR0B2A8_9CRUS|nr:hypothetical protein OUZ56_027898 [Daphnia magna]